MHPATEAILKHFRYEHLPAHLQEVSKPIGELARFSGLSRSAELRAMPASGELSTVRDWLRARPAAAFVAQETLLAMLGPTHQPARLGACLAYRSWLRDAPSLV